jgi:hypothetical protein
MIRSKPNLEIKPIASELSFSKDSLIKDPGLYQYQLSCKLQPSQSTISGHMLSTNEGKKKPCFVDNKDNYTRPHSETLGKLTFNTYEKKKSDKIPSEKDSVFVNNLQMLLEQKKKIIVELEAILDSKTTTIVELQNEM